MKESSAQIVIPHEKNVYPSFADMKNGWCEQRILPEILGQTDPVGAKMNN